MKIFYNQENINNFDILYSDPGIEIASKWWQKEEIFLKSAIELKLFNTPFGSISILYGPRQIGKTASLKLFLLKLRDSDTVIFTDCSTILNKSDLYTHLKGMIRGKTTIILDEVQSVPEWHLALRSLYSEGKLATCRIWCTGSEARHLLESGERLPGRKGAGVVLFARPWSFREYMNWFHPQCTEDFRKMTFHDVTEEWFYKQNANWTSYWRSYCAGGGFPRPLCENHFDGKVTDETWRLYQDWILGTWSTVRTPQRSLSALSRRLCETLNSRVSHDSLRKGTDISSPNTVKSLIEMQEDHFALRMVNRYHTDAKGFLPAKLKKIYPIDPFMAMVFASIGKNVRRLFGENDWGLHVDECAFLSQMLRHQGEADVGYIYSDTTKSEIDFHFEGCAFELKSGGKPTPKQRVLLDQVRQRFVVNGHNLPLMAYLVGEARDINKI